MSTDFDGNLGYILFIWEKNQKPKFYANEVARNN